MNFLLYCVLSLIGINQVMAVTIAPIVSTFGDNFRMGETTVSLSSSVSNYGAPIVSTLKPNFKTDTITTINIDFCVSYVDRENGEDDGTAYELIS
jgi:hypothetical protein